MPSRDDSSKPGSDVTRRQLLRAAGVVALPVLGNAACSSSSGGTGYYTGDDAGDDAGSGDDASGDDASDSGGCGSGCTQTAGTLVLSFAKYPALQNVGGSVALNEPGKYSDPICMGDSLIVVHASANTYVAVSSSCTHNCCTVTYSANQFHCPCHGSIFDINGKVLQGPARDALPQLRVCADACNVYVTLK